MSALFCIANNNLDIDYLLSCTPKAQTLIKTMLQPVGLYLYSDLNSNSLLNYLKVQYLTVSTG